MKRLTSVLVLPIVVIGAAPFVAQAQSCYSSSYQSGSSPYAQALTTPPPPTMPTVVYQYQAPASACPSGMCLVPTPGAVTYQAPAAPQVQAQPQAQAQASSCYSQSYAVPTQPGALAYSVPLTQSRAILMPPPDRPYYLAPIQPMPNTPRPLRPRVRTAQTVVNVYSTPAPRPGLLGRILGRRSAGTFAVENCPGGNCQVFLER